MGLKITGGRHSGATFLVFSEFQDSQFQPEFGTASVELHVNTHLNFFFFFFFSPDCQAWAEVGQVGCMSIDQCIAAFYVSEIAVWFTLFFCKALSCIQKRKS